MAATVRRVLAPRSCNAVAILVRHSSDASVANRKPYRNIAVVGTGTIGASWAALFARCGIRVSMYDVCTRTGAAGLETASRTAGPTAAENLTLVDTLEGAVCGADYIQESVLEDYVVKAELWQKIESYCGQNTVLGTSTSGLRISILQQSIGSSLASRSVVAHPFNPPHLLRLVEIVPGPATAASTVTEIQNFFTGIGKAPILLKKEVMGHIANRLQAALWREAISLAHDGVASVEDIDIALHEGPGPRWALAGMHQIFDFGGGDGGYSKFYNTIGVGCFEPIWEEMEAWEKAPKEAIEKIHTELQQQYEQGQSKVKLMQYRDQGLDEILAWKEAQRKES